MAASTNISYKGATIATIVGSGTKTLNTQGKYCEGDITVQCTDAEVQTQTKSVTPSETAQTVTPDSGKLLSSVSVGAIPSNYVASGVTRKAAATYTPATADQTIAAGQYLDGVQTVKGDANLVAGNIKEGVTIFGVQGTHSGGATQQLALIGSGTYTRSGTSSYMNIPISYSGTPVFILVYAPEPVASTAQTFAWAMTTDESFPAEIKNFFGALYLGKTVGADGTEHIYAAENMVVLVNSTMLKVSRYSGAYPLQNITYNWYIWGYAP